MLPAVSRSKISAFRMRKGWSEYCCNSTSRSSRMSCANRKKMFCPRSVTRQEPTPETSMELGASEPFRFRVQEVRVQGSGFRVQGCSLFRVRGPGFRVQESGVRIQGSGFHGLGSAKKGIGLDLIRLM
eukprot:2231979-Rhodomonas_salina.1